MTERGRRREPRVLCLHAKAPALGQAQWLHRLTALGPSRPEGPARPLKAALDRGTGRSPVPTAQPSPAWASPGSAAAEQSSRGLQRPGAHASEAPRRPQALLPSCCGRRERNEALPACLGPAAAPAGPSLHPSPSPSQGARGGGPLPPVRTSAQSTSVGRSPSLRGLPAGAILLCSATLGSSTLGQGHLEPRRKKGLPPGCHCSSPASTSAGLACPQAVVSLFPSTGPGLRGVLSSSHGPLLPSHTQVLGSAKQVQATEWPQRGLWSATST